MKTRDDRLRVEVADTGVGIDGEPQTAISEEGRGLPNTSARLERTYGNEARLHTASNRPTGFIVWFSIPRDTQHHNT